MSSLFSFHDSESDPGVGTCVMDGIAKGELISPLLVTNIAIIEILQRNLEDHDGRPAPGRQGEGDFSYFGMFAARIRVSSSTEPPLEKS